MRTFFPTLPAAAVLLWGVAAEAQTPRVQALRLDEETAPLELDGRLDEAWWARAQPMEGFREVFPVEGEAAGDGTEVRFACTSRHLYIGIRCFDREPSLITARDQQRDSFEDESFPGDDHVQVVLDPFGRERDGFLFAVNPLGAMTDGRIEQAGVTMVEWDGIWDARAVVDEKGWTAELVIPFSTLSFDPSSSVWGANIQRVLRRREEMTRWVQPSQSREGDWLTDLGELSGMVDLDQGLGYEFKPYTVFRRLDSGDPGEGEGLAWRTGFDASWLVTPALTTTFTVNTDFAETEVDDRQVNLGRFPLFFPEKRDFFLRDAPYFSFPSQTGLLLPFFSRNIGRTGEGAPVDILGGAKVTGRAGPYTVGILDVQQRGYEGVPGKNLLAARVTRELGDDKTLGLLVTRGDPYSEGDNAVAGADFTWRTTEFMGGRNLETSAWVLGSDSTRQGRDAAFGASGSYNHDPWEAFASFTQIGRDFSPALGYLERSAVREYTTYANYRHELSAEGWRSVDVFVEPALITDLSGRVESAEHLLPGVVISRDSGDSLLVMARHSREQLFEPFEIRPGIEIPEADYSFRTVEVELSGAPGRTWVPKAGAEWGGFYDGDLRTLSLGMTWRPSVRLSWDVDWSRYDIDLPEGSFVTRLVTSRLNLAFSPRFSWNTLAQYDNESSVLGFASRARWTVKPGTDLYLILNEGFVVEPGQRLRHTRSETSIKGGVTWRF